MRYLIQGIAMISDVAVLGAMVFVIVASKFHPVAIGISYLAYLAWQKTGGFIAWKKGSFKSLEQSGF